MTSAMESGRQEPPGRSTTTHAAAETLACPACDLLQHIPPLPPGGKARCRRCREILAASSADSLDRPLALALAAAIVFVIANSVPLLELSAVGREASTTIIGATQQMWRQGQQATALVVAFCAVIAPAGCIALMLAVLLAVRRPPAPHGVAVLLRWAQIMEPWSMNGVMMLGILVALIKIAQLATVIPGVGLYALLVLIVLLAATTATFDAREAWRRIAWADGSWPPGTDAGAGGKHSRRNSVAHRSAARAGLVSCAHCALLSRAAAGLQPGNCPRCGAPLVWRRHQPIQRTWALLIAAAIVFIPANMLPVLTTKTPGSTEADTILSGVIYLYTSGSWPLALIVLVASMMIPLGKMVALAYLLISVQRGATRNRHERTRLYRLVEIIGRWSMLDVFVDTFVVALVQLQPLMSVAPGAGVVYFMSVVVLTMLAAKSFDPRLIWDSSNEAKARHG